MRKVRESSGAHGSSALPAWYSVACQALQSGVPATPVHRGQLCLEGGFLLVCNLPPGLLLCAAGADLQGPGGKAQIVSDAIGGIWCSDMHLVQTLETADKKSVLEVAPGVCVSM